jgi:DNA-binding transcriptional LysR family regulator
MNLRQIEVFRAVMLAGSVTDAARLLHVSQPGVSRMLAHIELQLDVRLFERAKGKLRPTPEAHALHAEVEQVYGGVKRIDDVARDPKSGARLTLRVLASPSTALQVVPRAISKVAQQFSGARLYMESQLVREIVSQLGRHEADVAICTLPVEHALLRSTQVGDWGLTCVFQAGHRFEARRVIGVRDVLREPLIAFSADTPQGQFVTQWCREHRIEPQTQIEVRSGQVACAMAATGAGVSVVDDLTARAWRGDSLGFRPISRGPRYQVFAVRNHTSPPSALEVAFVDQIKAEFKALRRQALPD